MKVATDSMVPLIDVGDIIEVKKVSDDDLEMFDIIVFWDGKKWMSHFVWSIEKGEDTIVTRSLKNSTSNDFPISRTDILGQVINYKISIWRRVLVALKNRMS